MKKILLTIPFVLLGLASCDAYLDNEPMDFADETAYFKTPADLRLSVNAFYDILPKMQINYQGVHSEDNNSDNQIGAQPSSLFYPGEKRTPLQSQSEWKFTNLRGINYFLTTAEAKFAAGEIKGNEEHARNYIGEGYFFRAYDYFRLLRNYGDLPILTEMLPDDPQQLAALAERKDRKEVVTFMLADLDRAIERLPETPLESGRVSRDAALLLKARVALYEATWQRYHAGTCFAPGSSDAFVKGLLDEAIKASAQVADARQLDKDYITMFNRLDEFSANDEVILARYYKPNVITHSASNYLGRTGAGTGLTRALVNSFLTTNGLPIYADGNDQYLGDVNLESELANRDRRLAESVKCPHYETKKDDQGNTVYDADGNAVKVLVDRPHVNESGNQGTPTGYEIKKWVSTVPGQDEYTMGTTATPIFRAAEAYLIYLEAYYERHHSLDDRCDRYWRALRTRAGVDPDYTKTIAATDLARENDLAVWSHGKEVDKTLYNIRRERRCEFVAEGMRLDDLKRWRALDKMVDYQPEGINFWAETYTLYKASERSEGIVSQSGISTYLHPLQKNATIVCYQGYNFPKQHYLEPIPVTEFTLCTDANGTCLLKQNPGWPTIDGVADYSFNCE